MARALKGLIAVSISVALALGLAEGLLQLVNLPAAEFSPWIRAEDTAYRHAAGLSTRMRRAPEYDVLFETNQAGLRDDEIDENHDGPRIVLLGDSFTSGYGVERGDLFADLLEQRLQTDGGSTIDVINAGVGGYEIVHQIYYFADRGRALEPDLVLYVLYLGNDLCRNVEWIETPEGLRSASREFPVRPKRDIKLARLLRQARYALREQTARRAGEWVPFDDYLRLCEREPDEEVTEWYRSSARLLARLRDSVEASGARFIVAPFAFRTSIDPAARRNFEQGENAARYDLDRPEREVLAILRAEGIETINLNDALRRYYETHAQGEPLYFEIDGHFNSAGHKVIADALHAPLRDSLAAR